MYRIPTRQFKSYQRPLQGGARVLSSGGRPQGIAGSYQAALDRANRANEQRYQQILAGYDALHGRVMGQLEGVGAAERGDIDREYRNAGSNVYSSLVRRGFGNSSLAHTMQQGVSREKMAAVGRMNDRLAQQRAGYDTAISQGKFGVMERRYDNGPDINQMLALYQGLGRAGYAGGGARIGQPIGMMPGMLENAYMATLARHLGNIQSGPMYQGGVPQANIRAQMARMKKYGNRVPPPIPMAPPAQDPWLSAYPIQFGARPGPYRSGYVMG